MASWLTPIKTRVFALAGYPESHTLAAQAIAFAEQVIERRTGLRWGSTGSFYSRVRLDAKSFNLPLPKDILTVASVSNTPSGHTTTVDFDGLGLLDASGFIAIWPEGGYVIEGTRGIADVPETVVKAASLLVNYYLGLSDSERSRYSNFAIGDFSGGMRFTELPGPEAEQLLRPWCNDGGVSAV